MTVQQPNFARTRDQITRVQQELSDQLAEISRTDELFTTFQWNALDKLSAYQTERRYTVGVQVVGAYTEAEMEAAVGPVESRFFPDAEQREPLGFRDLAIEYPPSLTIQELDLLNQEAANILNQEAQPQGAQGWQGPQGYQGWQGPQGPQGEILGGGSPGRQQLINQEVAVLNALIAALSPYPSEAARVTAATQARSAAIFSSPDQTRLNQIAARIAYITLDYELDLLNQEYQNITHGGGESARQALISKEVACLNTVISAMTVHHGTENTALNAAIQAKYDATHSSPNPSRLSEISSRIGYITSRGTTIGFAGSVTNEYYEESDAWLGQRMSRERGSLQQLHYAEQNQLFWDRAASKVIVDGAAESELGEYLFLLDEQNILADEITEIDTDPDTIGTTPIRTESVYRLIAIYQNQQETLGQELTMGDRLHADERANVVTEQAIVDGLVASSLARLTYLPRFYKTLSIRQDQEIRRLFDKNTTTLTDGFLLSVVSPTTVTIVNAYDGVVDLSAESAAKAPVKAALEAQLKALYDALADATSEAQRSATEKNIREKESEILAVSRVTIVYKYIDNPLTFNELLLPDINGDVVVKASPLVSVLAPPNSKLGDPKLGVINITEYSTGPVNVQYVANMATLFGTMTVAEKASRHAAIAIRQGQITVRLAQLDAIFRRRNLPTPVPPAYQGPQGIQGFQGPHPSIIELTRTGPQGELGYQGPQGGFVVVGAQGYQGWQGSVWALPVFSQPARPTASQISAGLSAIWTDSFSRCYLCYNQNGMVKIVELM